MLVFLLCAPVAEHTNGAGILSVIGDHHPAFTISTEVLAGVETEAAHVTQATRPLPLIFGTMSLCCVFDHKQTVSLGNIQDGIHVCRLPIQMHGKDGLGALR